MLCAVTWDVDGTVTETAVESPFPEPIALMALLAPPVV